MSKTLVTHINPHLDDITGIWLFMKFHPDFKDAEIEFVSAAAGNLPAEESGGKIYIGVGRGKFDEHKGDLDDSATSLVYKYLKEEGFTPSEISGEALEELVEFVRLDDLGRLKNIQYPEFSTPGFIRVFGGEKSSNENVELGLKILDRVYQTLINKQNLISH